MNRIAAIVLAGGKGSRMHSDIPKQYMEVAGRPVLYYTLVPFQKCERIGEIVLVTGDGEMEYCRSEIVGKYGFSKVKNIVPGGSERYHSVMEGLKVLSGCDYVMIHDGARPFVDEEIILRNLETAAEKGCAITGMPVKDTIRICGDDHQAVSTPDRRNVWQVQTPQTFRFSDICKAYEKMCLSGETDGITDDAMVAERFLNMKVTMSEGSYRNIKITSPEDIEWMRSSLQRREST